MGSSTSTTLDRHDIVCAVVLALGCSWVLLLHAVQHPQGVVSSLDVSSLLVVATVIALLVPLMVLHEAAHAIAGRAVGARLLAVQLGAGGRPVLRIKVAGVEVVALSGLLGGGRTLFNTDGLTTARVAAVVAAGPASALLVLCAALTAVHRTGDWRLAAVVAACAANLAADLVPSGPGPGAAVRNDARLLTDLARDRRLGSLVLPANQLVQLTVSDQVEIAKPAADVWAFVHPAETSLLVGESVVEAYTVPGSPRGQVGEQQCFVTRGPDGTLTTQVVEIVELVPGHRSVHRLLDHPHPAGGVTTVDEVGDHSVLAVEVHATVSAVHVAEARPVLLAHIRGILDRTRDLIESDSLVPDGDSR